MTPLRYTLLALVWTLTGGLHPRLAPAAEPPLPAGAQLRLGPTKFRAPYAGRMITLSPDGKSVIAFRYPERLRFLAVDTGKEQKVVAVADDAPRRRLVQPSHRTADGKRLVAQRSTTPS